MNFKICTWILLSLIILHFISFGMANDMLACSSETHMETFTLFTEDRVDLKFQSNSPLWCSCYLYAELNNPALLKMEPSLRNFNNLNNCVDSSCDYFTHTLCEITGSCSSRYYTGENIASTFNNRNFEIYRKTDVYFHHVVIRYQRSDDNVGTLRMTSKDDALRRLTINCTRITNEQDIPYFELWSTTTSTTSSATSTTSTTALVTDSSGTNSTENGGQFEAIKKENDDNPYTSVIYIGVAVGVLLIICLLLAVCLCIGQSGGRSKQLSSDSKPRPNLFDTPPAEPSLYDSITKNEVENYKEPATNTHLTDEPSLVNGDAPVDARDTEPESYDEPDHKDGSVSEQAITIELEDNELYNAQPEQENPLYQGQFENDENSNSKTHIVTSDGLHVYSVVNKSASETPASNPHHEEEHTQHATEESDAFDGNLDLPTGEKKVTFRDKDSVI